MFGRPTTTSRILYQLAATVIILPFLAPLVVIVATSFGGQGAIANYTAVLAETPFLRFLVNSAIVSAGTVLVVVVTTVLAGYAFSKLRFRGKGIWFNIILIGLILPGIALLVPIFLILRQLGLLNSYAAVILPLSAILVSLTLLLTRNYMNGIPDEIVEAARIDGASTFATLRQVILPLSRPIIAVIVIWVFLNSWNEYLFPLVFLQDPNMQVVTQVPTYFTSTYGSDTPKIFASLVLICLPVTITYVALQRFFERGLTAGALK